MTTKKDDVLIKVEGLHKIYGDFHALNGIDEEIHRGEVVVIVGPSGSGKSTFLRSLNLLEVPDQGHIYFEGVDITDKHVDINKHRQKMGMVFQHFNVFNNLSSISFILTVSYKYIFTRFSTSAFTLPNLFSSISAKLGSLISFFPLMSMCKS